jgi:hypothetical protein
MFEGGCACGFVRYRMKSRPIFVNCCHCRDCQRFSGSAFAINAMVEADRIELIGQGEPETTAASEDGPAGETTARCPRCWAHLWGTHRLFGAAIRFLYVGTLDAGETVPPDAHFFTRSKHPWITIPSGVAAFETLPGESEALWSADAQARIDAAMARGHSSFGDSLLYP